MSSAALPVENIPDHRESHSGLGRKLFALFGGLLTFESDWSPALSAPLLDVLGHGEMEGHLDIGCVAAHGMFGCDSSGCHIMTPRGKPATAFLFELIALLQSSATVPTIDVRAYARWLTH